MSGIVDVSNEKSLNSVRTCIKYTPVFNSWKHNKELYLMDMFYCSIIPVIWSLAYITYVCSV